jgi:alpha-L-fucosidase
MEDFREGERIREYVVEGLGDGQWKELSRGSAVGRKKIDCFSTTQVGAVRLRVTRSAAEPIIRRLAVFQVDGVPAGSQISPNTGTQGWQRCGNWTTQDIHDGKVALTIDLSPFIPKPGQYEIKFEESGDHDVLHISRATLLYEGEEATPGLLTGLSAPHTYNVNRTAQVTKDTSSVLKVDIAADGGNACDGAVWIRPRPLE